MYNLQLLTNTCDIQDFYSSTVCMGDFYFEQITILTQYLHFYSSRRFRYFRQHCCLHLFRQFCGPIHINNAIPIK